MHKKINTRLSAKENRKRRTNCGCNVRNWLTANGPLALAKLCNILFKANIATDAVASVQKRLVWFLKWRGENWIYLLFKWIM